MIGFAPRGAGVVPRFSWLPLVAVAAAMLLVLPAAAPGRERPALAAGQPQPPAPGIYRLADLNRIAAARIDRTKTFLLQPIDPLDNHGPHLPAGTNQFLSSALVDALAERLRGARPEWTVLILPALPVGCGPVGELGGLYMHPSTQSISSSEFRRFLTAWALPPGEKAFPNLFFISMHPDPLHHRALNDVSDFYYQNYGMFGGSVVSFVLADSTWRAGATALGVERFGRVPEADPVFQLFGGLAETSLLLHLMPERVDPSYATLEMVGASSWSDITRTVRTFGWPGYIGNPASATAEYGKALWESILPTATAVVLEMADGAPTAGRPRLEDALYDDFDLREAVRATKRMYERHRQRLDTFFQRRSAAEKEEHGDKSVEP